MYQSTHNLQRHNQIHYIINPKYLKKEREKNMNFIPELQNDRSFQTLSLALHLKSWAGHYEHEYISAQFIHTIQHFKN